MIKLQSDGFNRHRLNYDHLLGPGQLVSQIIIIFEGLVGHAFYTTPSISAYFTAPTQIHVHNKLTTCSFGSSFQISHRISADRLRPNIFPRLNPVLMKTVLSDITTFIYRGHFEQRKNENFLCSKIEKNSMSYEVCYMPYVT